MVADVNIVQVDRQVDIFPHVMIMLDMVVKSISSSLKLVASNATNETQILLVLFSSKLKEINIKTVTQRRTV